MSQTTCVVFTPPETVNYILDKVGYTRDLYGKKVLENSCGTGRFLTEIVERYIADARGNGRTDEEIARGLESDIHGIEMKKEICETCKTNLNQTAQDFGLKNINWNIRTGDALQENICPSYQYVIGNPPYITYYNLKKKDRDIIRKNFIVCKEGKPDYYYAFTEAAIKALAPDGVLAYLIPNNFMKNKYSEKLRQYLLPYLKELEDYRFEKIFSNHQTSSAIIICSKNWRQDWFTYIDREQGVRQRISKHHVQEKGKWTFGSNTRENANLKKFGDCFQVSAPIATLLNEAFVIKEYEKKGDYIEKDGFQLEKDGLRPAASPKSKQYKEENYIIFPYYYQDQICRKYDEDGFQERFPQIFLYLKQYYNKLCQRDSDKNCKWFEYGRSQALAHINQDKLLLSTLITGNVKYYVLDRETVPYSGMYIVPKGDYTLAQAEQILESKAFFDYIKAIGIPVSGKTYRISPSDVANFLFEETW